MEKGLWEQKKDFILFISNGDITDIIKIIQSLEDSGVSIDEVTETVKHEISKNKKADFLELLAALLVQQVISLVIEGISGTGVRRARRGYIDKNF